MKMFISFLLSIFLVLTFTAVLSYFFFMRDNRQDLEVYIDADGQIYLNGVLSTEIRATQLIDDSAYIPNLKYHPDSPIHYCFGRCE